MTITEFVYLILDENGKAHAVGFDISKAFNTISSVSARVFSLNHPLLTDSLMNVVLNE